MMRDQAQALMAEEMTNFGAARRAGDGPAAWRALERAHIIAQPYLALHLASHWAMLTYALCETDFKEVWGQCLRLALVPLGAISGRLPIGNTGRSNVSAFRPMPIPQDLLARMNDKS
jgi:hypothetical protein